MKIRVATQEDLHAVHSMIIETCRVSFSKYYPPAFVEKVIDSLNEDVIQQRINSCHFYVAEENGSILGCAAVCRYWDSLTESAIFTFFVRPDCQRRGIGKQIMETLEKDEYFVRATRVEIPASLAGLPFYKRMGYEHKNGEMHFEDGHFALEKFPGGRTR